MAYQQSHTLSHSPNSLIVLSLQHQHRSTVYEKETIQVYWRPDTTIIYMDGGWMIA